MKIPSNAIGFISHERARRSAARGLLGSAGLAVVGASLMIPLASPGLFGGVLLGLILSAIFGTKLLKARRDRARRLPGVVEIGESEISVSTGVTPRRIALARVEDGFSEPSGLVNLRLDDGEVLVFDAGSVDGADRVLQRAGVDVSRRTLRVPLTSAAASQVAGVALASIGIFGLGLAVLFWLMMLSIGVGKLFTSSDLGHELGAFVVLVPSFLALIWGISWLVGALRTPHVVVGADGVTVERASKTSFVPYRDVTLVKVDAHGVRIERKHGSAVLLRTTKSGDAPLPTGEVVPAPNETEGALRQRVLFDRIKQAASENAAPPSVDALDRGNKSLAVWRSEVKRITEQAAGYRSQGLSRALLHELLANGAAPPERRIAVALALGDSQDESDKQRVRIAIDTCADEAVKAALEQAAEGELEEETLELALRPPT